MSRVTATEKLMKQPGDNRYYSMDFSLLLDSETLTNPQITIIRQDDETNDLDYSGVAVNGQQVDFWLYNGTDKKKYRVEVSVETSAGETIYGDGIMLVEDE